MIILLGIILIWKTQRDRKAGFPLNDERTSRIKGKAALGTYYISLVFMVSILLSIIIGNEFLNLAEIEAGWAVIAIMLVSGFSYGLLSWYYAKKGEL